MSDITIVTAFFDIGRGNLKRDNMPNYMMRSNDTYLKYFSYLAKLENDIVVFTSPEFVNRIKEIRQDKPTVVITFDFYGKLKNIKHKIEKIQKNPSFISRVRPDLVNNLEYWSADYVLLTNLKTYFVNKAIQSGVVKTDLVSWTDFGCIRSNELLADIRKWQYDFNGNYVNFFTLYKKYDLTTYNDVLYCIFNNEVYINGMAIVSSRDNWRIFLKLVYQSQRGLLRQNIVDDDQGVFTMCLFKRPKLFKLNYLN